MLNFVLSMFIEITDYLELFAFFLIKFCGYSVNNWFAWIHNWKKKNSKVYYLGSWYESGEPPFYKH